jgi:hypothetical protein
LQATAERGDAINDFGPPIESQAEGRAATLKGTQGTGPVIRITAQHGSVAVRKEGTAPSLRTPEPPRPPAPPKGSSPVNLKDSEVKL